MIAKKVLKFEYKNWQGEIKIRKVAPIEIWFGQTQYHPSNQWFLKATDVEKGEERDFAMRDIIRFL